MPENIIKFFKRKTDYKEIELIKSIMQASKELNTANKNFESAEAELIDYYSYQIKASKAKLDYLIRKVKEKGIVMDMVKQIEIGSYETKAI